MDDLTDLSRSQVPFIASPVIVRFLVAASLGVRLAASSVLSYVSRQSGTAREAEVVLRTSLSS